MDKKHTQVCAQYEKILDEHQELKLFKVQSKEQFKEFSKREEVDNRLKDERDVKMEKMFSELHRRQQELRDVRHDLDNNRIKFGTSQVKADSASNGLKTKEEFSEQMHEHYLKARREIEEQEERLKAQVDEHMDKVKQLNDTAREKALLEQTCARDQRHIGQLERRAAKLEVLQDELQAEHDRQQVRLEWTTEQQTHNQDRVDSLEEQVQTLDAVKRDLERQLTAQRQECEHQQEQIASLAAIYSSLKKDSLLSDAELTQLRQAHEYATYELSALQENVVEVRRDQETQALHHRQFQNTHE